MSPIGANKIKMQFVVYSKPIGSLVDFLAKIRNKHTGLFTNGLFLKQTFTNQYFAHLLQQILEQ